MRKTSGETLLNQPPADCNLPPLSGAGSLRSPKFVRRDTILFSSNLSYLIINFVNFYQELSIPKKK